MNQKKNPEEILSKKRKIDILTHFQTIIDDPKHVICLTCSLKLSTYSLKSLKKHLSTQKHLKIEEKNNSLKMNIDSVHETKKPFKCNSCDSTFEQKDSLRSHTNLVHERKKPFNCNSCDSTFEDKDSLKSHTELVHERKKPHKCSLCERSFSQKRSLKIHMVSVHGRKESFYCTSSESTFDEKDSLKSHTDSVHERKKPFNCNSCDSTFEDNDSLKSHTELVHGRKESFNCTSSESTFDEKDRLKIHVESAHGGKNDEKSNIWSHFEILADDPTHVKCLKCKRKLSNSSIKALKKHLTTNKHKSKLADHICNDCSEEFSNKENLEYHIFISHKIQDDIVKINTTFETIQKQDVVNSINNNTVSSSELDKISETSFEIHVNYKCTNCTEAFLSKKNLETHIGMCHDNSILETIHEHQDEKKKLLKCTSCDSTFQDEDTLKIHSELAHGGKKPYKCSLCEKSFSQKGNLKMHIDIVHEGKKPHKCSECDESFSQRSQLTRHVDIVHEQDVLNNINNNSVSSCDTEETSVKDNEDHVIINANNNTQDMQDGYVEIKDIFEMHEKSEKYICSDCTEDFSTETSFKVHFKQYHDSLILTGDPTSTGYFHESVDEDISFKRKLSHILLSFESAEAFIIHASSEDSKKDSSLPEEMEIEDSKSQTNFESNSVLNCTDCNEKFSSEFMLMSHLGLFHTEIKDFECSFCLYAASQQLTLDKHIEMCHKSLQPNVSKCTNDCTCLICDFEKKLFKCTSCDSTFQDEDSLKIHIESAHGGKKPYKCSLCDFEFNSIFEVMSHVEEIHFDNQNNNTLNSESEISKESRSDHVNPKNSDPKMSEIPAPSSKKRTLSEESRSDYVRWVMDNFGSEDENTEFIEEPKSDHVNPKKRQKQDNCLHHKDEEKKCVKCTICDISFSKNSSLNQHNESVHEGRFECSDCNNVFGIKSALIQHIESVHKVKN